MTPPIHRGEVSQKGLLVFDDVARWRENLRGLIGKRVEVVLRKQVSRRSNQQNRWYRGVIVPRVAKFLSESKGIPISNEQAHGLLKSVFIGVIETPLGPIPKSSRTLTTEQFSDYCLSIQTYAATEWKLSIPNPNESEIDDDDFLEEMT